MVYAASPVMDLYHQVHGPMILAMKYAKTENIRKGTFVRITGDMTVSAKIASGETDVVLTGTGADAVFGVAINAHSNTGLMDGVAMNIDDMDVVDVLIFGGYSEVRRVVVPSGGNWQAGETKAPGLVIKGATAGNKAMVLL